jgi:hypothetical protein
VSLDEILEKVVVGTPIIIEAGKTYVLECDVQLSPEEADVIGEKFKEATNANCIIFHGGLRLTRVEDEAKS